MKVPALSFPKGPQGWAIVIGLVGVGLYLAYRGVKGAASAVANVNQGTPYAGAGVIGTLGNVTNQASGGTLASLGAWLGGKAYSLVNGSYDPNSVSADRATPVQNPGVVGNPVSPWPSVLQYNYKQSTVDTPAMLGTDQLFTPAGEGSSGSYSDSGPSGGLGPTGASYDFGVTGDTTTWN